MTTDDRTRAIAWFEKQSKCLAMPGAAKMFGLAAEALNALDTDNEAADALERLTAESAEKDAEIERLKEQIAADSQLKSGLDNANALCRTYKADRDRLQAELDAAVEKAISWGVDLIEFNSDAHVTFCAECGFPIADYGVGKEISCTMCKAQNPSHNYVVTGPGSCRTTAERKAKIYDRLFGRGPQEAGKGETE